MMLLILMLSIPLVYSKPHVPPSHAKDIVQIEKQEIRLITHEDQDTKNILNKIEEVNRNQGWVVAPLHLQLPDQPSLKLTTSQSSNDKLQNLLEPHILSKITVDESLASNTTQKASEQLTDYRVPKELTIRNSDNVLIPYKVHPLFYYLKNLDNNRVIRIRNGNSPDIDTVTMILKPVAKAVAGQDGTAIATPLSTALVRQGMNVDILYEPEAVAIAGPGGIAHAQSDLEILLEEVIR